MVKDDYSTVVINYSTKVSVWMGIVSVSVLTPFCINSFINQKLLLGFGSLFVIVIMSMISWRGYKGKFSPWHIMALIPVMIAELLVIYRDLGVMGAFWSYPILLSFYFIVPLRYAFVASMVLIAVTIPYASTILPAEQITRIVATLLAVALLASIAIYVIKRQQQELKEKELLRRDSMVGASHELRTPLATLVAQISAMLDGIRPLNQEQLSSLLKSTTHLGKLVEDLYLLSLADASVLSGVKQEVQFDQLLQEAISSMSEKFSERNFSLHTEIESPVWVLGNETYLRQIIDNLLINCYRYTNSGGVINILLKIKTKHVELSVMDTGPGVSEEALPRLFDRYYREERSRSRKMGGAGLGLALVQSLTEFHDGTVEAFHTPEGGLGILLKLPLVKKHG